jgi:hypothetical protein
MAFRLARDHSGIAQAGALLQTALRETALGALKKFQAHECSIRAFAGLE